MSPGVLWLGAVGCGGWSPCSSWSTSTAMPGVRLSTPGSRSVRGFSTSNSGTQSRPCRGMAGRRGCGCVGLRSPPLLRRPQVPSSLCLRAEDSYSRALNLLKYVDDTQCRDAASNFACEFGECVRPTSPLLGACGNRNACLLASDDTIPSGHDPAPPRGGGYD